MTQRTSAWSLFADASLQSTYPSITSPTVEITPNRLQVDRRFPVLGFTVDTGGLPYFEVLLTTDRSLFDPANAARRMGGNFYASRQDVGLQRADGGNAVWLAPGAVVRGFATMGRVYYMLIAYADERGGGPVLSRPLGDLVSNAPAVSLAPDLASAQSLSRVLGVPLSRLARANEVIATVDATPDVDPAEDAAEGEDGVGVSSMLAESDFEEEQDEEEERELAAAYALADDIDDDEGHDDYDDGFEGPAGRVANTQPTIASATRARASRGQYHDEADDAPELALSRGLSATFPSGAPMPGMLWDAENEEMEGEAGTDRAYEDYGSDEPFALEAPPEFESLDASAPTMPAPRKLDIADMRDVVRLVAPFESGAKGYAAINADGEFEGKFGHDHPAYQRWHVGLSYGIVQFTQDSGALGRLLTLMRDRDAAQFRAVFGPAADELVRVTNLAGPASHEAPGGRSVRVQPIGGADIWTSSWRARFEQAATHVPFQAAQNQLAAESYLLPMLTFARWLGLDTQRALAMVCDRAVQMGIGGARRWITEALGPVQTPTQRQAAFAALGHADLRSFQRATPGLDVDGDWGPITHAAMVSALRALGDRSPLPIPTREQMLDAIERRAEKTPWAKRVRALRRDTVIADEPFTF